MQPWAASHFTCFTSPHALQTLGHDLNGTVMVMVTSVIIFLSGFFFSLFSFFLFSLLLDDGQCRLILFFNMIFFYDFLFPVKDVMLKISCLQCYH